MLKHFQINTVCMKSPEPPPPPLRRLSGQGSLPGLGAQTKHGALVPVHVALRWPVGLENKWVKLYPPPSVYVNVWFYVQNGIYSS
jgi:hypothetical protein